MDLNTIKIEGKNVEEGAIINHYIGPGVVIGTVFGRKSGVKRELKEYAGKGYQYIYFAFSNLHTVRIIDLNAYRTLAGIELIYNKDLKQ